MIGKKFGKLKVVAKGKRFYQPSGQYQQGWTCVCECGNTKDIRGVHLKSGRVKSCNCNSHGLSGTKLHTTWRSIKNRCKENYFQSHLYFEKGIKVCKEWDKSFIAFKDWAMKNGYKEGLQIDRIDNSRSYTPDNCRFVTNRENANNRDCSFYIDYKGEKVSLALLLYKKGLSNKYYTIRNRIVNLGWNAEKAVDTPIRKIKK